jgi:lipopolysaccharide transport protein LptA
MRYDSRAGQASFSGDVQVTLGEITLRCDALEVTYHREASAAVDFVAAGAVRVERPGLVATAGQAQYEGAVRALTLTGSPRVEGDVGVLEGSRIVLGVDDQTVTVDDVSGTFRVRRP